MAINRARIERIGRALVHEIRVEKIPFLAGSIAYHAFVSLLPLFALLLYVASGLGNSSMEAGLIRLSRGIFTEGAQDVLITEMRSASQSTGVSVLGTVVLLWGTLRIFRGLDTAFSDIYETEAENTLLDQFTDGIVVLITFSIAVTLTITVYRVLPMGGPVALFKPVVIVIGLTLVLLPMYYVFPDTDVSVPEILPGTVFAAVGLTIFQAGFEIYVRSGQQNVLSGILLLLTWLYASGLVVLLGVVINAVLSNRSADVSIQPVIGGVTLSESDRVTRTELQHALSTLNATITARTPIEVAVEDETIALPPPARVEIESDNDSRFGWNNGGTILTLKWQPRPDGDAEAADDEST